MARSVLRHVSSLDKRSSKSRRSSRVSGPGGRKVELNLKPRPSPPPAPQSTARPDPRGLLHSQPSRGPCFSSDARNRRLSRCASGPSLYPGSAKLHHAQQRAENLQSFLIVYHNIAAPSAKRVTGTPDSLVASKVIDHAVFSGPQVAGPARDFHLWMGCDKLLPQNEPFILQTTLKIAELRNDSLGVIRADVHEWTRMSANTYRPCACHFTVDLFSIDTNL